MRVLTLGTSLKRAFASSASASRASVGAGLRLGCTLRAVLVRRARSIRAMWVFVALSHSVALLHFVGLGNSGLVALL